MKRMFVSDFDRTLYVNSNISPENIQAVKNWQSRNNLFVVATGRAEEFIREKLWEYNLEADYIICNNGARIVSADSRILYQQQLDESDVKKLVGLLTNRYRKPVDMVCANEKDAILQVHARFQNREKAKAAADVVNQAVPGVNAFANEWNLDIVKNGIDKAEAITLLMSILSWEGDVAVIGDSLNDLEMIRYFQGFTVETAGEVVKQAAHGVFESVAACMGSLEENI